MVPLSCEAETRMTPRGGLPVSRRSAGVSMPWSAALRSRCVNGSLISSSTWRSSSVSAPVSTSSISLPSSVARSRVEPRQLLPGRADGLHARFHHPLLQLGRDAGEPLQRRLEVGVLAAARDLDELVAGEHQLRDHRHQAFQRVEPDADGLDAAARPAARRRRAHCAPARRRAPCPPAGAGRRPRRLRPGAGGAAGRGAGAPGAAPGPERVLERSGAAGRGASADAEVRGIGERLGVGLRGRGAAALLDLAFEIADQVGVVAFGLRRRLLQRLQDLLDPVDRGQRQRHRVGGDGRALAEPADHRFRGVRQRLEARQAEEAAGALDGVHQPEDVGQHGLVVRLTLETDEFAVDTLDGVGRLGQELAQNSSIKKAPEAGQADPPASPWTATV